MTAKPSHTAMKGNHPENIIIDMDEIECAICGRAINGGLFCANCEHDKPNIVKAVNSHDALVAENRAIEKTLKELDDPHKKTYAENCELESVKDTLVGALKFLMGAIDDQVLVRNIDHDHESDYHLRMIIFTKGLKEAQSALRLAGEGSSAEANAKEAHEADGGLETDHKMLEIEHDEKLAEGDA